MKPWNTTEEDHFRSFLMAPGSFRRTLDGPVEGTDRLLFWGAWEAPARGIELGHGPARMVFLPILTDFPNQPGLHVTDPFVFDGPFLYSCCQQKENPSLRNLERGDVVLFGSKLRGRGDFVVDTVFVVADSELYETHAGPEELGAKVPRSFVEATLKPLALKWPVDEGHPCATTVVPY